MALFLLGLVVGLLLASIIVLTIILVSVKPEVKKVLPKRLQEPKIKAEIIEPKPEVNEIYEKFFRE